MTDEETRKICLLSLSWASIYAHARSHLVGVGNSVHELLLACFCISLKLPVDHMQVAFPGLYVFFHKPFRFLALPALAMVFFITLLMLRLTPKRWIENADKFWVAYEVFKKVSITFFVYMVSLRSREAR